MNKQILGIFLTALLLCPFAASAQIWLENPLKWDTIAELIESIANIIFWVALAIAPLMALIGAYNIMTSGGEPAKVKKGRDFIVYAAIGLGVLLMSKGIISGIRYILGG